MHAGWLSDLLVILLAAILVVTLLHNLKISPILGYLAAGLVVGPFGLKAIADPSEVDSLAELGIVFMLFTIGLELNFERLKAMRYHIFAVGGAQFLATGAALSLIAWALGLDLGPSILVGGALALSSTVAVLKLLTDRGEAAARFGRIAVAVLLLQDLAVVPILALVPLLGQEIPGQGILNQDAHGIGLALGAAFLKAGLALALILVGGRYLVRPLFKLIAATGHAELFTATGLFIMLGVGWAALSAGMSMALGAFLAGILLAGTPYRHQIEADILPFRGLLIGLFFMTVGMAIDLPYVAGHFAAVLALCLGLILVKAAIMLLVARGLRLPLDTGLRLAGLLAQGSEFAFVITAHALSVGVLPEESAQILNAAVVISIAATPGLAGLGAWAARVMRDRSGRGASSLSAESGSLDHHVVVAGYGRVGQVLCRLLESENISYVALDLDVQHVVAARLRGHPVYFGDASRLSVLKAAGIARATMAVIAVNNPIDAEHMAAALKAAMPGLPIIARARDQVQARRLDAFGISRAVPEDLEIGASIGAAMLGQLGLSESEVAGKLMHFRAEETALLAEPSIEDEGLIAKR